MSSSISLPPTILLPNLPPKTFVGIDLITFTSTPNFHGIRDLPEGWHFLYTGTTESFSLRTGAWFHVGEGEPSGAVGPPSEIESRRSLVSRSGSQGSGPGSNSTVYIWKWDAELEMLVPLKGEDDAQRQEAMRYKADLGALWQGGKLFRYRSRVSSSLRRRETEDADRGAAGDEDGPVHAEEDQDEEAEEEGRRGWQGLTHKLSPRLLSRVVGPAEIDIDGRPRWTVTSGSSASRDADNIPGLSEPGDATTTTALWDGEREFFFLPVELKRTWREGAIGRERTEAAQDRSWALSDLIHRLSGTAVDAAAGTQTPLESERLGEAEILGELQFTFLMTLTMMNYSCLQQWKRLLNLIFTCRKAIKEREPFFADVLRLLLRQLQRCDDVEGGLFEMDGDEGSNFLRRLLTKFRIQVQEIMDGEGSPVVAELNKLEEWVKAEYNWELRRDAIVRRGMMQLEDGEEVELEINEGDEDDETGEYAPVIVDLGESRQSGEELDMDDA